MSKDLSVGSKMVVTARKKTTWSQRRLAQSLGVSKARIGHIESGETEPKIEVVQQCLSHLGFDFVSIYTEVQGVAHA